MIILVKKVEHVFSVFVIDFQNFSDGTLGFVTPFFSESGKPNVYQINFTSSL